MRGARNVFWYSVLLTTLTLPEFAKAQIPTLPDCGRWITVSAWQGTVTLTGNGQVTGSDGTIYKINETITGTIKLDTPPVFCGNQINWVSAQDEPVITASINDEEDTPDNNCNPPGYIVSKVAVTNGKATDTFAGLLIDVQHGTYRISFTGDIQGEQSTSAACGMTPTVTSGDDSTWGANQGDGIYLMNPFRLPDSGFTLSGTQTYQGQANLFGINPSVLFTWTATWNLTPVVEQLEVVIDPQGYDIWRPQAAMDESTPGNTITIQATLQYTSGKPANTVAQKFIFQLANVSAEPGITMNFPVNAPRPANVDLQFTQEANPTLSISPQRAETLQANLTQATAAVTSFDWGAWGEIQVTAIMPDGTQIQGHLRNADTTSVLLPKRSADSHIADVWKQAHNVAGQSDDDDSETDPLGMSGCIGDGLTLYEEYRGFIENGKHIEGDPQNKDLFIQNRIGADVEPGLFLFADLTGLTVHKDLKPDEIDGIQGVASAGKLGNKLINANHDQGAHQTDQHGVIITRCLTSLFDDPNRLSQHIKGVRGRPGLDEVVCLQLRDEPGTANPGNTHNHVITGVDAYLQYDIAVAHELLHAVGDTHHGAGDRTDDFVLILPGDPGNSTDYVIVQRNSNTVHLLSEATHQDLFQRSTALSIFGNLCRFVSALPFLFPSALVDACQLLHSGTARPVLYLLVGVPHGQHSGNDQCTMRYSYAQLYPDASNSNNFFVVAPRSEPRGAGICNSTTGTGVNDPGRQPQPRYFDADGVSGGGACQMWICVNDKYPPVPVSIE